VSVGEDCRDELRAESVEMVAGVRSEEGKKLVACRAL
jgi:quinol monooxygenase YgiN